ncbi:uncharacterized protein CPUR_04175 [Claviceps purpurea 20.1]|uniref:Hydrophobic surface binding protein A n=1 Tax=Claviceps purpurea (strain 20.1) TaxID=1111077 RepID=M1VVY4_CLAP2|nr:hypothetical protein E4U38_005165 [Claviceps purpurea]KAG6140612.1 hypothetical protein E4U12_006153 [Claviceps purpurea]KAG6148204.1 hypothetical protein E4U28_005004 [Claviceps purpurea]CCE30327.1 uncharacterized protein CPUR_04175 [Claviceps purpurea 20.1]
MISLRNLLFLAVAVTGSVIPRDVGQVKKDLVTINADTQEVTKAVNGFNGDLKSAPPILTAQHKLTSDIKTATDHAKAAGKVNEPDADFIINYISGQFQPSIDAALSAIKSKKDKFQGAGLAGTVKTSLTQLKGDADALSDALIGGAPASRVDKAKGLKAHISAGFDDAIKAFN